MKRDAVKTLLDLVIGASFLTAIYSGCNAKSTSNLPTPIPKPTAVVHYEEQKPKLAFDTYIIDAGHGGKDHGATQLIGLDEKDLTLALATSLKAEIQNKSSSKVVLTRSDDSYISPKERAEIANRYAGKNAYFMSLHVNDINTWEKIFSSSAPSGAFVLYADKLDPFFHLGQTPFNRLQKTGRPILEELAKTGFRIQNGNGKKGFRPTGEVRGDDVYILESIDERLLPGIYELGFIGNSAEVNMLQNTEKIAQAIYKGLAKPQ